MRIWRRCWLPRGIIISLYLRATPGTPTARSNSKHFPRLSNICGRGTPSQARNELKSYCSLPICLEESMAVLIDAINVKRKNYIELDNIPYHCLEAEVNTPTARGG